MKESNKSLEKSQEIMQKVRRIEMQARQRASSVFAGQYRASFRGQGLDFDDLREYSPGDDPRFIDWKVTARTGIPYVRKFHEEREQVLLLAIDVSASMNYASRGRADSKLEYAAQIAAVLAYSAAMNGDKVGLLLYGRKPHLYLPPAKGMMQTLRIIREIISSPRDGKDEDIESLATEINRTQRKRAMVFMMSDFLSENNKKALGKLKFRHEIIPVRIADPCELELPEAGEVYMRASESDICFEVDLSKQSLRRNYKNAMQKHRHNWQQDFTQLGIDYVDLLNEQNFIPIFSQLFKQRGRSFAR